MSETTEWVPDDVDQDEASSARVYDYLLGGASNFACDRALAEKLMAVMPAREMAMLNRAFLRRAVLFLVEQGVRQFIDLGSGIPTVGNVHEVAQKADPSCRVVYVDIERVAVAHAELMLDGYDTVGVARADMRDPDAILRSSKVRGLLDLSEPVGLLIVAMLHFIPDSDDPWGLVARYRDALASGSYLALSTITGDSMPANLAAAVEVVKNTPNAIHPRTRDEITRLFDGFELVEPGVVYTPAWRPERAEDVDEDATRSNLYAGVARKP